MRRSWPSTLNPQPTRARADGAVLGRFGEYGTWAGQLDQPHEVEFDSKGNIYTTEVDTGKRAQKFRYVGPALTR